MPESMQYRAPDWMRSGEFLETHCTECNARLRRAEGQEFCVPCWEWRTRMLVERGERAKAERFRKQMAARDEVIREENYYRVFQDEAAAHGDFRSALRYKWRIAVLEMTGQRFPLDAFDADPKEKVQ